MCMQGNCGGPVTVTVPGVCEKCWCYPCQCNPPPPVTPTLEQRVLALEFAVNELKQQLAELRAQQVELIPLDPS